MYRLQCSWDLKMREVSSFQRVLCTGIMHGIACGVEIQTSSKCIPQITTRSV